MEPDTLSIEDAILKHKATDVAMKTKLSVLHWTVRLPLVAAIGSVTCDGNRADR
jgi:hypothetical protein